MNTKNAAYSKGNVSTLRYAAAALAFASQLAYLWSLPGEFVIRPLVGAFVLLAAIFQGLLAVSLLFGPGRWMRRFGILLNATIIFVWIVTRFWGFPAAMGFTRLPVEPLGLAATAVEVALIVLLVRLRMNQNKEGRYNAKVHPDGPVVAVRHKPRRRVRRGDLRVQGRRAHMGEQYAPDVAQHRP